MWKRSWPALLAAFAFAAGAAALGWRVAASAELAAAVYGIATGVLLMAIAMVVWIAVSRPYVDGFTRLQAGAAEPLWLVSRARATTESLSAVFGVQVRLPFAFALSLEPGVVRILDPRDGIEIATIARDMIQGAGVGRVWHSGVLSECLLVDVRAKSQSIEIPFILFREKSPGLLTRNSDQLAASSRALMASARQ